MPRRNFALLILLGVVSLLCYQKVETNRYGRVMVEAMEQIERRSLKQIGQKELFEGALQGMMDRLEDPYSGFVPPKELRDFNQTLDQQFGGVGMEVSLSPQTERLTVMNPVVGTPAPAYRAGIRAGDTIRRIDDRSTQGLSLQDAVGYMRGEPDSPVTLAVLHQGQQHSVEIEIVRRIIQVQSVLGDIRQRENLAWNFFLEGHDRIGYVRIRSFSKETADELQRALKWLDRGDMQGLILDLRDNPGGLLEAAAKVCDMFIDSGVIVTTRRRGGKTVEEATGPGTYLGFPMAVLVNQFSASASEIVAACLQDHGRAKVVGQRTWGKGTVQEIIDLPDQRGALRLTTASYWRPSQRNIHKEKNADEDDVWGVQPDEGYEVVINREELLELRRWRLRRDVSRLGSGGKEADGHGKEISLEQDRQLMGAVQYIETQLAREHPGPDGVAATHSLGFVGKRTVKTDL